MLAERRLVGAVSLPRGRSSAAPPRSGSPSSSKASVARWRVGTPASSRKRERAASRMTLPTRAVQRAGLTGHPAPRPHYSRAPAGGVPLGSSPYETNPCSATGCPIRWTPSRECRSTSCSRSCVAARHATSASSLMRRPLPAGALAVLAPRPAAGPALAFLQLLLGPANAAFTRHLLLGILDPADELVAGQGRDVLPGIECRGAGDQRLAQVRGQLVHHPAGHSLAAHNRPR